MSHTIENGIVSLEFIDPDALRFHDDPRERGQLAHEAAAELLIWSNLLSAERSKAILELAEMGWSYGQIAEEFGFSRSAAQQIVERERRRTGERIDPLDRKNWPAGRIQADVDAGVKRVTGG